MNILLIHGLGRTPLSMWGIGGALRNAGHSPEFFGYTAVLQSFDDIAERLRDRLHHLSTLGPYGIVAHSLGGVLTRAALAQADFPLPAHVVMLAPPNQSPRLARIANSLPPYRWFTGQSGHNLANPDFYAQLPSLSCPYTIITGTVGPTGLFSLFGEEINDLIVGAEESKMHSHDRPLQVSALHSWIMNSHTAQAMTVAAFRRQKAEGRKQKTERL
ncbi:MAG: alpha/beta fold hydrolase [Phormidesmis sp.]